MLAINFARHDFISLTRQLDHCQVAPLLFVWGERAMWLVFGPSEYSMRLLPFLAAIGSMILFWRLTGLLFEGPARVFAIGFLSVAIWPVSMATFLKPYAFDLFFSLGLILLAVEYLKRPTTSWPITALSIFAPFALMGSYPAAFVTGGVSLAILRPVCNAGGRMRIGYAIFNFAVLAGFLISFMVGKGQLGSAAGSVNTEIGMTSYWAETFPPKEPIAFIVWLFLTITGQMFAYPIGSANGGSILTTIFVILGVKSLAQKKNYSILVMLISPIVLNFIAAVMQKYPFGGSGRLMQHLAPSICLLAGKGLAAILDSKNARDMTHRRLTVIISLLFVAVGVGGIIRDVIYPYRDEQCVWYRQTMMEIRQIDRHNEPIVILNDPLNSESVLMWYWMQEGPNVFWNSQIPPNHAEINHVWAFVVDPGSHLYRQAFLKKLQSLDPNWKIIESRSYHVSHKKNIGDPTHCELIRFEK